MTVIVVGGGINGVTSAIALKKRGHDVVLLDPGPLPHPLAASNDISKAVRGAYGDDEVYTELAERSVPIWRQWNRKFGAELYHEVGFLFMRRQPMQKGGFEWETARIFEKRGRRFERIDSKQLQTRFPAWTAAEYADGLLEVEAGYVEAGRALTCLIGEARSAGVRLVENAAVVDLLNEGDRVVGVRSKKGGSMRSDAVVAAAGAWTPYLLPFTNGFLRASGQIVFHLRPIEPELFKPERFPVFGADITATGYYGFPLNGNGIVKIGNHGPGMNLSPDESGEREVPAEYEMKLRAFLSGTFPALADAAIVSTRICMYCDTNDGDFWIAPDPDRPGLTISAGDNGHGFKFAPVLGDLVADAVEGKSNSLLQKFRWRPEVRAGANKEAARFQGE